MTFLLNTFFHFYHNRVFTVGPCSASDITFFVLSSNICFILIVAFVLFAVIRAICARIATVFNKDNFEANVGIFFLLLQSHVFLHSIHFSVFLKQSHRWIYARVQIYDIPENLLMPIGI